MTGLQRIRSVLAGLLMLAGVALLLVQPEAGYRIIALILSVVLLIDGVRSLWFYFSMARHMVGGRLILFRGIIALDLGMFAYSLQEIPPVYILLYLLVANLFAGVIDVLRAMEAKRMESRWRLNLAIGIANILLALSCGFCFRNPTLLAYVYAAGLAYSACLRIAQAFPKTAIVYIP
ncbi:MAG: DUF308 domain-containing protein [Clostridia bacterium]|nr:DUF308 domain-containing protein [Clostridia bacterium]